MRSPTISFLILGLSALSLSRIAAATPPATLGDTPEAFSAKFGPPLEDNGPAKSYMKCAGSGGGTKWKIVFGISQSPKGGFVHQAAAIERHGCGSERLDSAAAKKEALGMMPADAKLVAEFLTPDGRHAQEYRSTSLGKTLPADHFIGCSPDGKTQKIPEGTFSYALSKDGRSWNIITGTCF